MYSLPMEATPNVDLNILTNALDCFTVSLHNPNGRRLLVIRAVQGTVSGLWKMVEIPIGHVWPEFIMTEAFPNLYSHLPITKGRCQSL